MADAMNALRLPGVIFRPIIFKPFYGRATGKTLKGVQVHLTDRRARTRPALQFRFLQAHHALYPEKNPFALADSSRLAMFEGAGSHRVRQLFTQRMQYDDVKQILQQGEGLHGEGKKYWLYQ